MKLELLTDTTVVNNAIKFALFNLRICHNTVEGALLVNSTICLNVHILCLRMADSLILLVLQLRMLLIIDDSFVVVLV